MQYLVDTYECEWKAVVNDPERRKFFRQFINTDATEPSIEFVQSREQQYPAPWPNDFVSLEQLSLTSPLASSDHVISSTKSSSLQMRGADSLAQTEKTWVRVGAVADFPVDGGAAVKYGAFQIAVFNFASRGEWYACQNLCPHKRELVLARGIIGDQSGIPKVACPLHKKTFSLESGECLSGEQYQVNIYPVKTENESVFLLLNSLPVSDSHVIEVITCSDACESAIHK
jgi:nitrite reductase (NADH) large subunit